MLTAPIRAAINLLRGYRASATWTMGDYAMLARLNRDHPDPYLARRARWLQRRELIDRAIERLEVLIEEAEGADQLPAPAAASETIIGRAGPHAESSDRPP